MIEIQSLNGLQGKLYDGYSELFDCLMTRENLKLLEKNPDFNSLNWSFVIYPPKRVAMLHAHQQNPSQMTKEAFENGLSLVEVCTGDYENPVQIVLTPNINLEYLKKKWCLDYCRFHHLIVREYLEKKTGCSILGREVAAC